MRTLQLSLAGTLILSLLGGLGATAVAQEADGEPPTPNGVVVTATELGHAEPQGATGPGTDYRVVDGVRSDYTWEATDPRLSGAATYTGYWHTYFLGTFGTNIEAVAMTVVNEDGTWSGAGRGIGSADYGNILWLVLTGDGAYEGLTAYLTQDYVHEAGTIRGVILADELPPFPEPAFAE